MWDNKTGTNVSALEESERFSGSASNHQSRQEKKIFESTGQDSGYLSEQILFSSDSIEDSAPIQNKQNIDLTGTDSGYIPSSDNFGDSGLIQDKEYIESTGKDSGLVIDNTKDTKPQPMLLENFQPYTDAYPLSDVSESFGRMTFENNLNKGEKVEGKQKQPTLWDMLKLCFTQDDDGDTRLHSAILAKYKETIVAIIRLATNPAFIDIRNDDARSPLHLAVLTRQPDVVRLLWLAGAKTTSPDKEGNTPLHLACMISDKACFDALTLPITKADIDLLQYNNFRRIPQVPYAPPELEQRNYDGMHCVHIAAQRNDIVILKQLYELGADINAREGKSGYTALHMACENSNEQLAQYLLTECTERLNIEAYTYGQLTAYQLADEQKNSKIIGCLKKCGAVELPSPDSDDDSFYGSSEDDFNMSYESEDCDFN